MNYGRGAGKTYTIMRWLEEDPKRRFLVSSRPNGDYGVGLQKDNIMSYDTSLNIIKQRVSKHNSTEIAFDDFDFKKPDHLHVLLVLSYLTNIKTVILATTIENMPTDASRDLNKKFGMGAKVGSWEPSESVETDAAKTWRLAESKPPKIEGAVAEGIIKAAGYIGREYIKQHNARVETDSFSINEQGGLTIHGDIKVPEESEPIQKVMVRDLRLGDYIAGKGIVVSLTASGGQKGYMCVEVADHEEGTLSESFRGKFPHLRGTSLIDIDITKRK